MKKILSFLIALLVISSAGAQQTIIAKRVNVSDTFSLAGKPVGAISNDTTAQSKASKSLITEYAAKNYTDNKINAIPAPNLSGKLNVADTASMLAPYATKAGYLNKYTFDTSYSGFVIKAGNWDGDAKPAIMMGYAGNYFGYTSDINNPATGKYGYIYRNSLNLGNNDNVSELGAGYLNMRGDGSSVNLVDNSSGNSVSVSTDGIAFNNWNRLNYVRTDDGLEALMWQPDNSNRIQMMAAYPMAITSDSSYITRQYADSRYNKKGDWADTARGVGKLKFQGSAVTDASTGWAGSLYIGRNPYNTDYPGTSHGYADLIISPNSPSGAFGQWQNTLVGGVLPDVVNSFNTLLGNVASNTYTLVNSNSIHRAGNATNYFVMGSFNAFLGSGDSYGGDNNVLIGSNVLTQAGGYSTTNTKNASNQINIGGYLTKDSVGHFGVGRWAVNKGTAVDFGNFSDGGMQIPQGTTAQRLAIASPTEGLLFYDKTLHVLCFYNGTNWQKVTSSNAD